MGLSWGGGGGVVVCGMKDGNYLILTIVAAESGWGRGGGLKYAAIDG